MATRNPQLTPIQTAVGPAAVQDWTQVIRGAETLGTVLLNNRKENILEGFRGEVQDIVEQAEEPTERNLSAEDEIFTSEFATRMNRINRIATQGVNQGARSRALLEAETALRRAQNQRPGLAAELRQEAALVLGTDPTGTRLEMMESLANEQSQQAQQDWAEHVKHGYEDLGIPRTIAPGSAEWYSNYSQLEERFSSNIRVTNDLALIKNIDDINESNRANAQYWLSNPEGVFRATVSPLNQAMQVFSTLSPDARLKWMGGDGTLDIAGKPRTGPEFRAFLEAAGTELDASYGGLNTETREALRGPLDSLKSRISQTLDHLNDPSVDPAVLAAQLELETQGFMLDMTQDQRYNLVMIQKYQPYLDLLVKSDFASLDLVQKNKLIDALTSMGGFTFRLPSERITTFRTMLDDLARKRRGSYSPDQGVQLAYQDYLTNIRDLNGVLANSKTEIPEDVAVGYVSQLTGAAQWINETPNVAPELIEQWLETIQDPQTLEVLQRASPQVGEEYARELVDFFNSNVSPITKLYEEIDNFTGPGRTTNIPVRGRAGGQRQFDPRASEVLVPEIREDGTVVIQFAPGSGLTEEQKVNYTSKMRTWGDALTRRVKAQATLDQLISNESEPDYRRAYLKMAQDFPFTRYVVPGN